MLAAHEDSSAALGVGDWDLVAVVDFRPVAWDFDVVVSGRVAIDAESVLALDGDGGLN